MFFYCQFQFTTIDCITVIDKTENTKNDNQLLKSEVLISGLVSKVQINKMKQMLNI